MNAEPFSFALSGVSCGKCVAKMVSALRESDPDVSLVVNDSKLKADVITTLTPEKVINVISSVGYSASLLSAQQYETSVANVSCQRCVQK